jgi:hypothetical protein
MKSQSLDVLIYIPITKNELNEYKNCVLEREALLVAQYLDVTAKTWMGCAQLRSRALNFDDFELLSTFTGELIRNNIRIDNAINLALALRDMKPYAHLRDVMKEQFTYARGNEAFTSMDITDDREMFVEYVEKHRQVCVYSEEYPLKVLELPIGVGFMDLIPKTYIIEPFLAIVTDTVEKPLVPPHLSGVSSAIFRQERHNSLPDVEKTFPLSLGARSSMIIPTTLATEVGPLAQPIERSRSSSAIQNYYILRKNTREQIMRDNIPEFLSIGCYATKLIFFTSSGDAQVTIDLIYKQRGRSKVLYERTLKKDIIMSKEPEENKEPSGTVKELIDG